MKDFLEKTLRQNISMEESDFLDDKLPLAFKGRYVIYKMKTNNLSWMAIKPKNDVGLVTLRKDRNRVESVAELNCAIFLDNSTFYIKEKLVEEGIPFVVYGKQVYLPFIGFLLTNDNKRDLMPVHMISFLTQKLIFIAIYDKWSNVTVSEAAKKLDVSKMSISRCFDEIEYLNINILTMKKKSRAITIPDDIKNLWDDIKDKMRNPVIERYLFSKDVNLETKAGISALSGYSLLNDNIYPTYAITKNDVAKTGINNMQQARQKEEIGCVVLKLGYFIDFKNSKTQDPLSVVLSLTETEMQDERINISVNDMLKNYVW